MIEHANKRLFKGQAADTTQGYPAHTAHQLPFGWHLAAAPQALPASNDASQLQTHCMRCLSNAPTQLLQVHG